MKRRKTTLSKFKQINKFKHITALSLSLLLLTVTACGRKPAGTEQTDPADASTQSQAQEEPAPVTETQIEVPAADKLVNKVLNLKPGTGTVSFDVTVVQNGSRIRAWMQEASFQKGETAMFLDGTLHVTYGDENETLTKDDAAQSFWMPSYLTRIRTGEDDDSDDDAANESEDADADADAEEGTSGKKSHYELYVYDETDDTWEREIFAPALVSSARMMMKRMVTETEAVYVAPDGTVVSTGETCTVRDDDPGELQLTATVDTTQVLSMLDGFGLGPAISDAAGQVKQAAGEAVSSAAATATESVKDAAKETAQSAVDAAKETAQSAVDAAKEAAQEAAQAAREQLGDSVQDAVGRLSELEIAQIAGAYAEQIGDLASEHAEALLQYFGENKEALQAYLEENGDALLQYFEENKEAAEAFLSEHADAVTQALSGSALGEQIDTIESAVQGVQDYRDVKSLLNLEEPPKLHAVFDPLTGELQTLTLSVAENMQADNPFYIVSLTLTVHYTDHETPVVTVPQEVLLEAEDKEQGMAFHRMMEELERIGKQR